MWQLSGSDEMDKQVLNIVYVLNVNLKDVIRAGEVLRLDELMVKAFHRGLNGMMKIICKP